VTAPSEISALLMDECNKKELRPDDLTAFYGWMRTNEDLGPQSEILVWGIVDRLVGQNKDEDERVVQTGILSRLTDLLTRETNHDHLIPLEDSHLLKICFRVLGTLGTVPHSDEVLKRADTVGAIFALCRKIDKQDSPKKLLLEEAITCLALMAPRSRHKQKIITHSGVPFILNLLKKHSSQFDCAILVACCRFITKFAEKEQHAVLIFQNDGIDALLGVFIMACHGFHSSESDTRYCDKQGQYREVIIAACTALWVCCVENEDIQDLLGRSGFVIDLATIMKLETPICPEPCFGILRRIAKLTAVESEIEALDLVKDSVLKHGFKIERDSSGQICGKVKEVIGFVGNIASSEAGREALVSTCAVKGTVEALDACCESGDVDRKTAKIALAALVNLTVSKKICEQAFLKTDICTILLQTMKTFGHNTNVLEQAMNLLSHLAADSFCCRKLLDGGAGEAILCYLTEHQQDLFMNKRCVLALRRMLATSPEAIHSLLVDSSNEGLQRVLNITKRHVYDQTVAQELVLLLEALHLPPQVLDLAEDTCHHLLRHHSFLHPNMQRLFGVHFAPVA